MIKQTITGIKHGYQAAKSFVLGKGCVADKLVDTLVQSEPKVTRGTTLKDATIATIQGIANSSPLIDKAQIKKQNELLRFLMSYELPDGLKKVKK